MDGNSGTERLPRPRSDKILLSAIVIVFAVGALRVCLGIYARWRRRRNQRRNHPQIDAANSTIANRGLDAAILRSLPLFIYPLKTRPDPVECAVCLSEFKEGEAGRLLPKCYHVFHSDCIDTWFRSRSTCPLCRSLVERAPEILAGVVLGVHRGVGAWNRCRWHWCWRWRWPRRPCCLNGGRTRR
ncbi:hypothetical protein NMG60_11031553 [Bertholletia excelsa]